MTPEGRVAETKATYVRGMFGAIAPIYDRLNSIISLGLHKRWKRRAVQLCRLQPGDSALDVCTGTADLALELSRVVGDKGQVVGVDFCAPMLQLAMKKLDGRAAIRLLAADAQSLPFADNSFDAATVAFGLRNVADLPRALRELARVVRPGGRVASLDLARPRRRPFRDLYQLYFFGLVPFIGRLFGNREAYHYLPNSLLQFPDREPFSRLMEEAGMYVVSVEDQLAGAVAIHVAVVR